MSKEITLTPWKNNNVNTVYPNKLFVVCDGSKKILVGVNQDAQRDP